MKKLSYSMVVCALACMLAFVAGCSSSGSASGQAASSGESASAAQSAEASAVALDPNNLADGEYQAAVTLSGGSGKATVESPAKLNVKGGDITAIIVWSSPNYDQMIVGGVQYLPVPRDGNSTFEIPVEAFDKDIEIQAETTAMSEPHMIDYTLRFDSSTLAQM